MNDLNYNLNFLKIRSNLISGRHRKIIIHVPVKFKKQKHVHTVVKPVHVHHKPSLIKEEKIIRHEVHKPIHIHKEEFYEKPAPVIEYKKKEIRPIYKEEISHEHLHHHYKVNFWNLQNYVSH